MRRITVLVAVGLLLSCLSGCKTVAATQTNRTVRGRTTDTRPVATVCASLAVSYPLRTVFLRAFKQERELELWSQGRSGKMELLRTYAIAAASGGPGPKRREGDMQVPEGVYQIDRFNPQSRFHLSLGLNYPNQADRILGDRVHLGGDIFIHGNQVSIGCLAMTDTQIDEIYKLASQAKSRIVVDIFPCRMEGERYRLLKSEYPQYAGFWSQLEPIYSAFEQTHKLPRVSVNRHGQYVVSA